MEIEQALANARKIQLNSIGNLAGISLSPDKIKLHAENIILMNKLIPILETKIWEQTMREAREKRIK